MALTQYFPLFFKQYAMVDPRTAGFCTASYSIAASIVRSLSGPVCDKVGGDKVTVVGMAMIAVGSFFMGFSPARQAANFFTIIAMVLMAIGGGAANAGVYWWISRVNEKQAGAIGGLVGGLGALGGFFIPLILGGIANAEANTPAQKADPNFKPTSRYASGFFLFTALALIAMVLNIIQIRRANKLKAQKPAEEVAPKVEAKVEEKVEEKAEEKVDEEAVANAVQESEV